MPCIKVSEYLGYSNESFGSIRHRRSEMRDTEEYYTAHLIKDAMGVGLLLCHYQGLTHYQATADPENRGSGKDTFLITIPPRL